MNLKKFNNLVDLFFDQASKQNSQTVFLEWLNPINKKKFTWSQTVSSVIKLAITLQKYIKEGDRVLAAECRPIAKSVSFVVVEVKS